MFSCLHFSFFCISGEGGRRMYSRGKGVGTLTLFHTTKICDFFYPISNLDHCSQKEKWKKTYSTPDPVPEREKKNIQYFWPKRLKTIPILTISSQKPYYLGGGLFTPKIGEIMRSLCGREPIMLGRWNLLMIICLSVTYHDHQFPGCRLVVFAVFAFLCAICCSSSVFSFCSLLVQLFVSFS